MSVRCVGFDPGLKGGMAVVQDGRVMAHSKMPVIKQGGKSILDLPAIIEFICEYHPVIGAIEAVHAMPGQGVSSMFTFGEGYGSLKGIMAALEIGYHTFTPQSWQKKVLHTVPKDLGKKRSVAFCSTFFPDLKKLSDGEADAICIALYGSSSLGTDG